MSRGAMARIQSGFAILGKYDDTGGDVSLSFERALFAGPQNDVQISVEDAYELEQLGWEFHDEIGRWGIYP